MRLYEVMDHAPDLITLHLVPLSASADDRWRLSDGYVAEVWSEHLGPMATLLARRFGRMIEDRAGGVDVDLTELASAVGVQPAIALKALDRRNRFEVVYFAAAQSIVGVSGYVPSIQGERLTRLSELGRLAHDRLVPESEVAPPTPSTRSVRPAADRFSAHRAALAPGLAL